MHYVEATPVAALRPHVRCIWELRAAADPGGPAERVLPDGCGEIIINRGDPFAECTAAGHTSQAQVLVVGQMRRFIDIVPTGEVLLTGIRFEAAGLRNLLGIDASELTDARVDLADVSAGLRRRLLAACDLVSPAERLASVQKVLCAEIERRGRTHVWLPVALEAIQRSQGLLDIDGLSRRLHYSSRQIERVFRAEIGVPPKVYARIVRFERVVREYTAAPTPWSQLAYHCGYTDQAHLIREFRSFAGVTPAAYFRASHALSEHFVSRP